MSEIYVFGTMKPELKSMIKGENAGFMLTLANPIVFHKKRRPDCRNFSLVAL